MAAFLWTLTKSVTSFLTLGGNIIPANLFELYPLRPHRALFFHLFFISVDMTATPDGISFGDLQKHMNEAQQREEAQKSEASADVPTFGDMTPEEITDFVDAAADALTLKCAHPMVHKAMIVELCERMVGWHTQSGLEEMENGNNRNAVFWERDAGKFQAILNIISSISMGPGDYLMR